ncbi:unnamed protein product, partial [marine sediment metagenome]
PSQHTAEARSKKQEVRLKDLTIRPETSNIFNSMPFALPVP